jgi:hypothetical protein
MPTLRQNTRAQSANEIILRVRDKVRHGRQEEAPRDEEFLEFENIIKPATAVKIFDQIDRLLEQYSIRGTYNSFAKFRS